MNAIARAAGIARSLAVYRGIPGRRRFQVSVGETGRFLWPDWRSGHEVRAWLLTLSPGDRSGDIYARAEA